MEDEIIQPKNRKKEAIYKILGGFAAIAFGLAWIAGVIALAEFVYADMPRAVAMGGGLFLLGGIVAIIAGIGDLVWAIADGNKVAKNKQA